MRVRGEKGWAGRSERKEGRVVRKWWNIWHSLN